MSRHDGRPSSVVELIDLPVDEASGLWRMARPDATRILVVGDRALLVASAELGTDGRIGEWVRNDVSHLVRSGRHSQFEAVATDGGSLVALLREEPSVVITADASDWDAWQLRAEIALTAPDGSLLDGRWDDPASRGEGLILLRDGRLLVAKEKKPRALVLFAPADSPDVALTRDDFLDPSETWEAPEEDTDFVPIGFWRLRKRAKKALHDVSALATDLDRSLWLLSDKSRAVARLTLDSPLRRDDEISDVDDLWELPPEIEKPEGMVVLDDRLVLVAMDTDDAGRNGAIVALA
jgi:hypothetical protein